MEFGYTENPGYADLLRGAYNLAVWDFRGENWHENNTFVRRFQLEFTRLYRFEWHECLPAIYCSLIFTLVRYFFELYLCRVIYINFVRFNFQFISILIAADSQVKF